ncbi:hypothetical protein [Catellatospora sp. NPDC049133]|uniref:hypothetical protein n=1 Tax=Catellatospora sp. NPDC049133 TaxID=3155499 RepID=UPI0033CBFBE6
MLLLCCGGGVGVWYLVKDTADQIEQEIDGAIASASAQVAAKEITVVAPATLAGRPKSTDPQLETVTDTMKSSFEATLPSATGAVAAFYGDQAKRDLVMIFAASARITDPGQEVDAAFAGMGTSGVVATGIVPVDAGPLGGEAKCGSAKTEAVPLVVCAWADKGSLGMVVWYFKTVNEVKAEFIEVRGQIEQVG